MLYLVETYETAWEKRDLLIQQPSSTNQSLSDVRVLCLKLKVDHNLSNHGIIMIHSTAFKGDILPNELDLEYSDLYMRKIPFLWYIRYTHNIMFKLYKLVI